MSDRAKDRANQRERLAALEANNGLEPEPTRKEVIASLPPRRNKFFCAHGISTPFYQEGLVGDFITCVCCGRVYSSLGHGTYYFTEEYYIADTNYPHPHFCEDCGGGYQHKIEYTPRIPKT